MTRIHQQWCHWNGQLSRMWANPNFVVGQFLITAQYPVLRTGYKGLYTLLPWQTCSIKHHQNFFRKHPAMVQLMLEGYSYKYPPLYSHVCILLSELEQCRVIVVDRFSGQKPTNFTINKINLVSHAVNQSQTDKMSPYVIFLRLITFGGGKLYVQYIYSLLALLV